MCEKWGVGQSPDACRAREVIEADTARAKEKALNDVALLARMFPTIAGDALWREEYERFVSELSYARGAEAIDFDQALPICARLANWVLARKT